MPRSFMPRARHAARSPASARHGSTDAPTSVDSLDRRWALRLLHGFEEHFFERALLRAQMADLLALGGGRLPEQLRRAALRQLDDQTIVARLGGAAERRQPPDERRRIVLYPHLEPLAMDLLQFVESCPAVSSLPLPSTTT